MIKNKYLNMKKKILGLIVFTLCITFLGAGFIYAADTLDGCKIDNVSRLPDTLSCPLTDGSCLYADGDCGMCCLLNSVYNITDWVFVLLMAISSLMIIWGAVTFTTSSGDPEKTGKARQLIIYAAVGIAVALFSRAIPPAIKMIIGV
ncbi:MAG: Type secretion system pilin [Patescibacteria group bacterium]|nr:Type secretion system pilin [Patescibacteria group bacterium]